MKPQRLKITEPGMTTYNDWYAGFKFTDGLSDEAISVQDQHRIGAYIRVEACDDGRQVGEGQQMLDAQSAQAEVKVALADATPETTGVAGAEKEVKPKYTRETLEQLADAEGIQGLRAIAEKYGVKGRGIVELITEILKAQG